MSKLNNIIKGWYNYLNDEQKELALERSRYCNTCDFAQKGVIEKWMPDFTVKVIEGMKCTKCGCPLSAKLRSKDEKCPLDKW